MNRPRTTRGIAIRASAEFTEPAHNGEFTGGLFDGPPIVEDDDNT